MNNVFIALEEYDGETIAILGVFTLTTEAEAYIKSLPPSPSGLVSYAVEEWSVANGN